jgi:hypothetical protein
MGNVTMNDLVPVPYSTLRDLLMQLNQARDGMAVTPACQKAEDTIQEWLEMLKADKGVETLRDMTLEEAAEVCEDSARLEEGRDHGSRARQEEAAWLAKQIRDLKTGGEPSHG